MPIGAPIPMPQFGTSVLANAIPDIMNNFRQNQLLPYQKALIGAQAQAALQKTMLNRLMLGLPVDSGLTGNQTNTSNQASANNKTPFSMSGVPQQGSQNAPGAVNAGGLSVPTQPQGTPSTNVPSSGMGSQNDQWTMQDIAAALSGTTKSLPMNGKIATVNPATGHVMISGQIGESPEKEEALKEKLQYATQNAKTAFDYDQSAMKATTSLGSLNQLNGYITDPIWQGMRELAQYPQGGKLSLAYYQKQGTPEQQKIAGEILSTAGQAIRDNAQYFKGMFRRGEQGLLTGILPTPDDTVKVAEGKIQALSQLSNLSISRNRLTAKLIRQGSDPSDAGDIADQLLKGEDTRQSIANNLHLKYKPENSTSQTNIPDLNNTKIFSPQPSNVQSQQYYPGNENALEKVVTAKSPATVNAPGTPGLPEVTLNGVTHYLLNGKWHVKGKK